MSNFKFEILHLRGALATTYRLFDHISNHLDYVGFYNSYNIFRSAYAIPHDIVYNACEIIDTKYGQFSFGKVYDIIDNIINDLANKLAKNSKNMNDIVLNSWKEIIKLDLKTRDEIKSRMTIEIYNQNIDELKLIDPIIDVDVSKMIPLVQTYYYYSLWSMITVMSSSEDSFILMKKFEVNCKKLDIPKEYSNLLKPPELEMLNSILVPVLTSIIQSYYGLIERSLFLSSLLELN